jgi:hypothetical protein
MTEEATRPAGTVTIKWSGVFTDDWRTNPHRPNFECRMDPPMPRKQIVRLLRFVADDFEASGN